MSSATIHALPHCPPARIFELRRTAEAAGTRYIPSKPRQASTKTAPITPFGGDAA